MERSASKSRSKSKAISRTRATGKTSKKNFFLFPYDRSLVSGKEIGLNSEEAKEVDEDKPPTRKNRSTRNTQQGPETHINIPKGAIRSTTRTRSGKS